MRLIFSMRFAKRARSTRRTSAPSGVISPGSLFMMCYICRSNVENNMQESLTLEWRKFHKLTEARLKFAKTPCVYVQADPTGHPIRVGKASKGLEARYRGGTGYAIDAAMHESKNLVFIAAVPKEQCEEVENELIWQGRRCLTYNNQGKLSLPFRRIALLHTGDPPKFVKFEAIESLARGSET